MTRQRVGFVIGGVQKCGTSALATWLSSHPRITLPAGKEAHVFDAPGFDDRWGPAQVDALYATHFQGGASDALHGDATPAYLFLPRCVERIARYNPAMRWILLLRDPVDRAISHYHMERNRGHERLPLLPAMCLERWRLRRHQDDLGLESPLRRHSYLARGDYARQLDRLYRDFPRDQVLLLRSDALLGDSATTLSRVHAFLGVEDRPVPASLPRVFVGDYTPPARNGFTMRCMRWLTRRERRSMGERYGLTFE